MKPFIGIECEGTKNDIGKRTFFVPNGSVMTKQIPVVLRHIRKERIKRIYFGAGNRRGMDSVCTELAKELIKEGGYELIVECANGWLVSSLPKDVLSHLRPVLMIPVEDVHVFSDIKFQTTKELVWHKLGDGAYTPLTHPEYANDKEIDLCE